MLQAMIVLQNVRKIKVLDTVVRGDAQLPEIGGLA